VLSIVVAARGSLTASDRVVATFGYSAVAWLGAAAILHVTQPRLRSPGGGFFALAPLRFLGRYSYGIYVWHYPIMIFLTLHNFTIADLAMRLGTRGGANAVYVATNVAATLAVALLSWRLLEQPLLGLKRHFSYRALRPTPARQDATIGRGTASTEAR
jgi:peptidoglycan/LPS O-acetylase OafA/YrhL